MKQGQHRKPMLTEYSKSSQDVEGHTAMLVEQSRTLLDRQRKIAEGLHNRPLRSGCIVCRGTLIDAQSFSHRGIPYVTCQICRHIQCSVEAPENYPYKEQDFADIYRPLDPKAFADRTARIYQPKLDWALRAGEAVGLGNLLARRWVELGCGAGYFLSALRNAGGAHISGVEIEPPLIRQATAVLGDGVVSHFNGSLADAVRQHPAEVYAAWFVLEHCFETASFLDALSECPSGTAFMFAVPTYGLATLLESACDVHFARSLDSVLHLQLFTDQSIRHAMASAGYEIKAEWLFGQDADDLYRAIAVLGKRGAPQAELERLAAALSDIQGAIDRARLSDARHILALKT